MKKIISILAILMAALMLVTAFAACGSKKDEDTKKNDKSGETVTEKATEAETEAPTEAPTEEPTDAPVSADPLTGTYSLTKAEGPNSAFTLQFKDSMKLIIHDDTTAVLVADGLADTQMVVDRDAGEIINGDTTLKYTLDGDTLTLVNTGTQDTMEMVKDR